jgi:hypothetical protein
VSPKGAVYVANEGTSPAGKVLEITGLK